MDLLQVVVILVIIGVVLMLVNKFIEMDSKIKLILNYAVVIFTVIWLLQMTGIFDSMRTIRIH